MAQPERYGPADLHYVPELPSGVYPEDFSTVTVREGAPGQGMLVFKRVGVKLDMALLDPRGLGTLDTSKSQPHTNKFVAMMTR